MPNPREELAVLWRDVNREMHESFHQAFRGHDFPPVTVVLFRNIHTEPGITLNELARRSGIVKSHVSKLVDQLVKQGYVEKQPDPEDQRLVRLYLTQAAADKKTGLEAQVRVVLNGIFGEIPEAEVDDVFRGLRILQKALKNSNKQVNT